MIISLSTKYKSSIVYTRNGYDDH